MVSKTKVSEYCKRHKEKYKDDNKYRLNRLLQQAKLRAKKRNLICNLTIDELLEMIPADMICPVLGIKLQWGSNGRADRWHSPSLDRLDSHGDYTKDNVIIISWRANKIKGDCTEDELEAVLDYMRNY
jgi:hypothetical protein